MTDFPVSIFPDVERLVVDVLGELLGDVDGIPEGTTLGVGVPPGWTTADPPHLQVRVDASDSIDMPVAGRCTVALIARADATTTAKAVASRAAAVLACRKDLIGAEELTGPITARDPDAQNVELATTTVAVVARST